MMNCLKAMRLLMNRGLIIRSRFEYIVFYYVSQLRPSNLSFVLLHYFHPHRQLEQRETCYSLAPPSGS